MPPESDERLGEWERKKEWHFLVSYFLDSIIVTSEFFLIDFKYNNTIKTNCLSSMDRRGEKMTDFKDDLIRILTLDSKIKNEAEEWYREFTTMSMEDLFEPFTV
ncbi:MAG TPA: hypothetical protein P5515_03540 [Methanolinea sp.]|nr:hypothetical protein [Methanolinea sp.]HQJ18295.1 hypothetical protein [Methanolinea sp.]HRU79559.1 hypothetical protein [Methanolinea sp.]